MIGILTPPRPPPAPILPNIFSELIGGGSCSLTIFDHASPHLHPTPSGQFRPRLVVLLESGPNTPFWCHVTGWLVVLADEEAVPSVLEQWLSHRGRLR